MKTESVRHLVNSGPFPGMSEAFDQHIGAAAWTDPAWRDHASLWAAAWKKALAAPAVPSQHSQNDMAGSRTALQALTEKTKQAMWRAVTLEPCTHENAYMRGITDAQAALGIPARKE